LRLVGILSKTALMVAGSLAVLLGLGVADPGNRRLMPSFFSTDPPLGVVPRGAVDEQGIHRAIAQLNDALAAAYLELDSSALAAAPVADPLRRGYVEEIAFLAKDGRALEMTVRDIRIAEVRRLPERMLSVDTVESVKVRYLRAADRTQILAYPETQYAMNYTLEESAAGWRITGVQTMAAGKRDD